MKRMKIFYVVLLPVIWSGAAITSYFHPGDELGILAISTIPGIWICFFMEPIGEFQDIVPIIIGTGVVSLAILGFLMDRARICKWWWGALFVVCFGGVLVMSLSAFESLDQARYKHGSLTAYVAGACNIGLYLSIVISFVAKGISTLVRRWRSPKGQEDD